MFSASCSRHAASGLERLAILPANVLVDDPGSDWLRAGSAVILEYDLSTSRKLVPAVVNDESAAVGAGAAKTLRLTLEDRGGEAWVQATVREISTQENTRVLNAKADSESHVIAALNQVAKELDANAVPFSTSNVDAAKVFSAAIESRDGRQRLDLLEQAIHTDASFGLAYALLVEGSPANSPERAPAIAAAQAHQSSFNPLDRARMAAILAKAEHQPLPAQIKASNAVLQVDPNDVDALVTLGSAQFLQGDARGGSQNLLKALQLSGNNTSVRRQLAQGLVETKQFAQAEKFVTDAPDAAICLLLSGDRNRANSMTDKLTASVPSPDLKILFRATWLAFSGQLSKAVETAKQGSFENPGVRAVALSQAALWQLLAGDAAAAQSLASTAVSLNPQPGALPVTARLLVETNFPGAAWRGQVESAPLSATAKQAVLGYGLFLHGNYVESAEFWKNTLDRSGGADLRARAMLAASLMKAGKADQAKSIHVEPFLPEWTEYYDVVAFNEMQKLLKQSGVG